MKTAMFMLVYFAKLLAWVPVIFIVLLLIKLFIMFGHNLWDVLYYLYRIVKFFVSGDFL